MILSMLDPVPLCYRALVFLDGEKQHRCIFADDENGLLARYCEPLRLTAEGDLAVEWKSGVVRIVDPEERTLHEIYTRCDRG